MSFRPRATTIGRTRSCTPLVTSLAAAFALGVVAACGDARPDASGSQDGGVSGLSDGSSPDGARADSASDGGPGDGSAADGAAVCTVLTPGPAVPETVSAEVRPAATGGTIAAGTYTLTERDFYTPSADGPPGGDVVQGIIIFVDGAKLSLNHVQTAQGVTTTELGDFSYTATDTIITRTQICPATADLMNVPFSVVGSSLWLFPTAGTREIYTRQ